VFEGDLNESDEGTKGKRMETQFMTVPEVAQYLRVAPITVYRLAEKKDLPGGKAGGQWRFVKLEVGQWLEWGGT